MYTCMGIALKKNEKKIEKKKDGTFVTSVDKKIHQIIKKKLFSLYPSVPIISEEGKFRKEDFLKEFYWLIDPIDGTSSFIKGSDFYTINIALIFKGSPILGIIGNPPTNSIWYGCGHAGIKIKNKITSKLKTNKNIGKNINIIMSKNSDTLTKNFINKIDNISIQYCSSSLKFCVLAEGNGDLYPRLESISKWDIAAGDAILRSAGGIVLNHKGQKFLYNTLKINTGKFYAVSSKKVWSLIN